MPPKGHVAGLNASNIITGSRKRGRPDDEAAPDAQQQQPRDVPASSSSPSTSTANNDAPTIATRRSAAPTSTTTAPAVASGSTSTTDPEQVTRLGYKLLNIIYHARDLAEVDDPLSLLVEPFLVLPDPDEYADYYQIIKRPLTYEHIRDKLDRREYTSFEQVKHDCEVICNNAKRYNQKDTPIWTKGKVLHSIIKDVYADLVTTPSAKSLDLDTKPVLLDIEVEGVEPITSAPPSPLKPTAPERKKAAAVAAPPPPPAVSASASSQAAPAPAPAAASPPIIPSGPRKITIKRRTSNSQIPTTAAASPPVSAAAAAAAPPSPAAPTPAIPPPASSPLPSTSNRSSPAVAPTQAQTVVGRSSSAVARSSPAMAPSPAAIAPASPAADMDVDMEADASYVAAPNTPSETAADKRRRPFGRGKNLKSAMKQWLNEIWDLKDERGESVTDFFEELPSRAELPQYYTIILEPISLKEISDSVAARRYPAPHGFFAALRTMIANAKYYNEEGSHVWNDAHAIERHLDTKLIPMILSEGFTLDPNDTRSSVLPLGHREGSTAALQSPAATQQRSLTPQGAVPSAANNRLKVKIQQPRPSNGHPPALSPGTSSAAESLIDLGGITVVQTPIPPPASGVRFGPPSVGPSTMPMGASSSPGPQTMYDGQIPPGFQMHPPQQQQPMHPPPQQQQQQQQQQHQQSQMPMNNTSASGRPMRSASGMVPRNLGSPQTITGQPTPNRMPMPHPQGSHQSPPPPPMGHGSPFGHGHGNPGAARSPPLMPMGGRPSFSSHGIAGSPPMRMPSGLRTSSGMVPSQQQPPVTQGAGGGGRFIPPPPPAPRESRSSRINALTTPMGVSPYQPPRPISEASTAPARDTSIPSFVVLSSDGDMLRKTLKTDHARQFAIQVAKGVDEVHILFRVKDFPPETVQALTAVGALNTASSAMDTSGGAEEADAEGEVDDSVELASVSSTTTFNTGIASTKTPQTFAEAPRRPPSPERYYKPRILTVYNGRYYSPRWSTTYPPPPQPHHADNEDEVAAAKKRRKMKEYAMLTLPLHHGANLLEVSLFPAPPNSKLDRLANGQVEEGDVASAEAGAVASSPPAARTLRGHVNGGAVANQDGDAAMATSSDPAAAAAALTEKARQLLGIGEAYRIWITRG